MYLFFLHLRALQFRFTKMLRMMQHLLVPMLTSQVLLLAFLESMEFRYCNKYKKIYLVIFFLI